MKETGRRHRTRADRGSVTVEAAVALGSLILVFALLLGGVSATADQMRCVDAASAAARLAARGDPAAAARAAKDIAPDGAEVAIEVSGDHVRVTVHASAVSGLFPGLELTAEAYAVREPGQ